MSLQVASPFQQFFGRDGSPLDNGFVYVGTANLNPETNPLTVYFDDALTIPAAQPLRTSNGYIVRNGSPARVYTSQEDFSLTVREKNKVLVFTVADATSLANLATQLSSSSGSSLVGYNQGGTGAVTRTVQARLRDYVSVKDFGAVGNGVTSDTAAIQAAISAANSSGLSLYFPDGTYMANSLEFTVGFTMAPEAKLKFNGSSNGYLADLTANSKRVEYASFDGATSNCTLFKINGDRNSIGSVYVANSTASVSGTSSLYGVSVLGDYNTIESISAYKLKNTGFSNESFPQAVFVSGLENTIQNVYGDDCQSLVVTGTTSDNTSIANIVSRNSNDNGVYWLGGDLLINSLDYYGFNEPLVCVGASPAKLKVGSLNNYGTGIIGLDNATGDVEIDNIFISTLTGSIIRTRSGNTASGSVKIQKITGAFTGTSLWDFSTGTVEYFSVSEMNVTFNYNAAVSGPITSWARFDGCKGFSFGSLKINIVDVNNVLTGSDYFSFIAPTTNLTYRSFVDRIDITIVNSNGFTQSAAAARGFNLFASNLVQVENARVQVNVGPYLREVSDATSANGIVIIGAAAPTIGTWRRGQVVWYSDASAGSAPGAVCVTAGTSGTWKAMANLAA